MLLLVLGCLRGLPSDSQVLDIPPDRPLLGSPRAAHRVVVFEDYDCPYCAAGRGTLNALVDDGDVAVIALNYPLNGDCNERTDTRMHPDACMAARASVCAHEQGAFQDYSDHLFANRDIRNAGALRLLAQDLELDVPRFSACLEGPASLATVREDTRAPREPLSGVPTFFVVEQGDWLAVPVGELEQRLR